MLWFLFGAAVIVLLLVLCSNTAGAQRRRIQRENRRQGLKLRQQSENEQVAQGLAAVQRMQDKKLSADNDGV